MHGQWVADKLQELDCASSLYNSAHISLHVVALSAQCILLLNMLMSSVFNPHYPSPTCSAPSDVTFRRVYDGQFELRRVEQNIEYVAHAFSDPSLL
jgi:hypothetical protein